MKNKGNAEANNHMEDCGGAINKVTEDNRGVVGKLVVGIVLLARKMS